MNTEKNSAAGPAIKEISGAKECEIASERLCINVFDLAAPEISEGMSLFERSHIGSTPASRATKSTSAY